MACTKRDDTGHCSHHQCAFSQETEHGYECVDILAPKSGVQFCEVGEGCLPQCPFSYFRGDGSKTEKAMQEWTTEMKQQLDFLSNE